MTGKQIAKVFIDAYNANPEDPEAVRAELQKTDDGKALLAMSIVRIAAEVTINDLLDVAVATK